MSVKVHEPVCLDSAQDLYFWFDHFLGDQVKDEWVVGGNAFGSGVVVDAQTGGIVRITTRNQVNDRFEISWNDIRSLLVSKKATMEVRFKANQTVTSRLYIQLKFDDNNRVFFYYDSTVDGNWHIRCHDGGVPTDQDSGEAVDTDYHIFRIECFPTGEVHFYIDGAEVTNSPITTNIPDDATDYLQPFMRVDTLDTVESSFDMDYCVVRQER